MKKTIKTFLAAFIACMAFFYLGISFYKLSLNPVIWGEDVRCLYGCGLLPLSVFIASSYVTLNKIIKK